MFYIFFNGWVTFPLIPSKRGGDSLCRLRFESGWAYWYWQPVPALRGGHEVRRARAHAGEGPKSRYINPQAQ